MKRKVDMIENEIARMRDLLEEETYSLSPYDEKYYICIAKINLCEQFLSYIDSLGRRK